MNAFLMSSLAALVVMVWGLRFETSGVGYTAVTNGPRIAEVFPTRVSCLSQASCSSAFCRLPSRKQCDGTASGWNVASPMAEGKGLGKLLVSSLGFGL